MAQPAKQDSGLFRMSQRVRLRLAHHRAYPRHTTLVGVYIHPHPAGAHRPGPAVLCDVSERGIGLFVDRRWWTGCLIRVEFEGGDVPPRIATVVNAREASGGWMLGCAVERAFTPAELEALLRPQE